MARSSVELLVMALALTHTLPEKPAFAYPEVAALLMAGFLASWRLERQIPLTRDLATLGSDVDLPLPPVHGRYSRAEILAAFAALDDRGAPRSHCEGVLLFLREQRRQGTITEQSLCLGFATYVSHDGERPMARCSRI